MTIDGPAATAWRDACRAIRDMPAVFLAVFIVLLLLGAAETIWYPMRPAKGAPTASFFLHLELWALAFSVIQAFLLAPLAIAVHRYVLLGEVTGTYALNPSDRRFMRFFTFGVLFEIIALAPLTSLSLNVFGLNSVLVFSSAILFVILLVIVVIVCARLLILFPAIAVDAPGIRWRNAMRDSKGHFWQIFGVMFVTGLPLWIFVGLGAWLLPKSVPTTLVPRAIRLFLETPLEVLVLAAFAAAASRLYRTYANQLGQPPDLAISSVA